MKRKENTKRLVEGAIMIALATILSMLKLVEMPYGGSITAGSMLPIVILSHRNGIKFGMGCGFVYAILEQLLGLKNLSYFTTWQSVVAIILLDYVLAFTVIGAAGIVKGKLGGVGFKYQTYELTIGGILVCLARYLLHTISGATVWAGLSIPTEAAIIYSLGYNLTYMLPETLILAILCSYLGKIIDFSKVTPTRVAFSATNSKEKTAIALKLISPFLLSCALISTIIIIAPHLQNPEDGSFTFSYIQNVNWLLIAITDITLLFGSLITFILGTAKKKSAEQE